MVQYGINEYALFKSKINNPIRADDARTLQHDEKLLVLVHRLGQDCRLHASFASRTSVPFTGENSRLETGSRATENDYVSRNGL